MEAEPQHLRFLFTPRTNIWAKNELAKRPGYVDLVKGVDLNQNQVIEEDKIIEVDNSGEIDVDKIKKFPIKK